MKIGMIGAESKHVEFFGIPVNKEKLFENTSIHCIWGGDTSKERLIEASDNAGIDKLMETPEDVIRESDAVMITMRSGDRHTQYALECLRQHKPVFIDKPFTIKIEDAKKIINASIRYQTPFTGGSTLCFLPEISQLQNIHETASYTEISYRADPNSPFGGWYFYGSHLTDLYSAICKTNYSIVEAEMNQDEVIADIYYTDNNNKKKVRIYSAPDISYPCVKMDRSYIISDKACYTYGLQAFLEMISSGKSIGGERLLYSVQLMDAILSSITSGKPTAVAPVSSAMDDMSNYE